MPRLTPADASLILDHVVGNPTIPAAAANLLLASLPFPSDATPRLLRSILLRRLASDPVSPAALDSLQLLAALPSTASPVAAAHLAVAAFLAASAPDFDAAAVAFFARPGGRAVDGDPALSSPEAVAIAGQFEEAVGNTFAQVALRGLWGDRGKAEGRVRDLLAAEWAALGPSKMEVAAERIAGDGAVETWREADEATRAKYRLLVGEERAREILRRLEEPASHVNSISTPEVNKVINALNSSCADLHRVVDDPLPAAKAAADEVLAARMDKAANCTVAGSSAVNDQNEALRKGIPSSFMDWNPTARSFEWEDSLGPEGSRSDSHRPHLPSPRRIPVSPLKVGDNKAMRRRGRKWSSIEEETLRKGVEEFGNGRWKDILLHNPDVFIGRTAVDLKDKWRNMMR